MVENDLITKEVMSTSGIIIKTFVETFLAPKLEKIKSKVATEYKRKIIGSEKYLSEYFLRSYNKYSVLNTLVFNNSERYLKDLFIPLTLKQYKKEITFKVDGFPFPIVKNHKKVLITDTAGMGKSTLVKKIFLDVIEQQIAIPILIELRRLNKDKNVLKEIQEQLDAIDEVFDEKLLLSLLNDGDFIFFLDGFDEISLADRDIVTKDIQQFISKTNNNKFFLTSRPESALSSFGDFQQYTIEPLQKEEAFQLLKKYDNNGIVSSLLINKLNQSEFRNIEEFLTNPLLVSLLFTAFEYKQVIPLKKHIFYRQVYDANFETHDLTKGDSFMHDKHSKLDIDDFHRVLRHVGYSCLKIQKIEFNKDELLNLIAQSKEFCAGLTFKASDFLTDLISSVPLFTKDGVYYRWSHKSLQEYFAAQFIYLDAKQLQLKILEKISQGNDVDKYFNILDLYYEIDYKSFRIVVMYPLLKAFKTYSDRFYELKTPANESAIISYIELTFPTMYHGIIHITGTKDVNKEIDLIIKKHIPKGKKKSGYSMARMVHDNRVGNEVEGTLSSVQYFIESRINMLAILNIKKDYVHKYLRSAKITTTTYSFLPPNELVTMNESIKLNPVFLKELPLINKILSASIFYRFTLNYKKSLLILKEIEKEKSKQNAEDYLLEGL